MSSRVQWSRGECQCTCDRGPNNQPSSHKPYRSIRHVLIGVQESQKPQDLTSNSQIKLWLELFSSGFEIPIHIYSLIVVLINQACLPSFFPRAHRRGKTDNNIRSNFFWFFGLDTVYPPRKNRAVVKFLRTICEQRQSEIRLFFSRKVC